MPNFISEDQIEQALLQHVRGFDVLEFYPADLNDGAGWLDKLDELLPARLKAAALKLNPYDRVLFQTKCDTVFHLVLDHAAQGHKWAA